jgi:MoaA/NifB/PqqE/SkfB family radical SAM enzyme
VIRAIQVTRFDSGYFVEKCLERLARLPLEVLPQALAVLEQRAQTDYRLPIVLGCYYMQAEDYERALRHLRSACDRNPCDLFAENALIDCTRRQAAKAGVACEFEGLEAYLAGSSYDVPWRRLEIYPQGNAFLCCLGWLPLSAGNVRKQSLEGIWNSELAMEIRKSILDGSFRYCSKIHCQHIAGRSLPRRDEVTLHTGERAQASASNPTLGVDPRQFSVRVPYAPESLRLCYDKTCNMACPQCRRDFFVAKREEQEIMDREFLPFMMSAAQHVDTLGLNGAGEVFASKHCRHLLSLLKREQFPRLKFWFVSNGQLLNERAFRDFDLYGRVRQIMISVDAARPETYRAVRRGGDFQKVLSSLAFLDNLRRVRGEKFIFDLSFVASRMNFRDMPEFVHLAKKFHVDTIYFSIISNWGYFSQAKFEELNVTNPSHPEHQDFLKVLESPELSDPIVDCGSVAPYRRHEGCKTVLIRQPSPEDS